MKNENIIFMTRRYRKDHLSFVCNNNILNILQTYVQDLIKKNKKEIYDMIVNKNAHFYVCGDVFMAQDIHTTLQVGQFVQSFEILYC